MLHTSLKYFIVQDDIFEMARAMFSQRSTGWAPLDDDDNLGSALHNENTSHICYGLCGKSGTGTSIFYLLF